MTSSYPELYTKNTRIWIKHPEEVWKCATITKDYDKASGQLYLTSEEENEICLEINDSQELPPLRNPDILIGSNDLTSLSYLHEPSVLYNLRVRFLQHNSIYTWCGIVLVAVNPFTDLEIYGDEIIQTYHSNSALSQLDPHIYAVAEDAYTKLECNNINQSVIVSGESGAGKTVSAKFAMRYFASIAGSDSNIEDRVLASNPIMEAIGNAKTVRNDNSSRFGKYIQILFDRKTQAIMGGNMRTYLLEKSRITFQSEGERNFHIFYQLCSYAKKMNLTNLALEDSESFAYLGSNEPSAYDDMTRFIEALETLGVSEQQKNVIFQVIAAILHGGNIEFDSLDDESCAVSENSSWSLQKLCELLSLDSSVTNKWLTSRLLKTGTREVITTPLNAQTAQYGLEALLKFIYEKLFCWIVNLINISLGPRKAIDNYQFIGVLDIYGFEHFEKNSFEQFCINYANEVLQQQFNLHVFKLEQEEYVREGIDWQFISFYDNQLVIDLIEAKPLGILSLLDEECRMPKGSDESWCNKLYNQIKTSDIFKKPKIGYQKSFIIEHFADVVTYSVDGFLEKNRDTIWEEQIHLLKRSTMLECLFIDEDSGPATPEQKKGAKIMIKQQDAQKKKKAKATVGCQFRESLAALMQILNSTEPHYVRCIKPNDTKSAFDFNNIRAVQQLRACGVLETIRISSNGYPSRWSYQDFANRYRVLLVGYQQFLKQLKQDTEEKIMQTDATKPRPTPRKLVRAGSSVAMEIRQVCQDIIRIVYQEQVYSHFNLTQNNENIPDSSITSQNSKRQLYQFGKTKIFFCPGQVALLERIRSQKLRECATFLQRIIRGWLVRQRYLRIRKSALLIQRYGRVYLARKLYMHLKQTRAATVIQTCWRCYHQRKVYQQIHRTVLALQTQARAYLARQQYTRIKQNLAAITIQRYWRGYIARKHYKDTRRKIILVQCCIRRHLAKKELRHLRIEARSVEHVTNLNRGLEKKIIELQQKIDEAYEENRVLRVTESKYQNLRQEFTLIENELSSLKTQIKEENTNTMSYKSELNSVILINKKLISQIEQLEKKNSELEQKIEVLLVSGKQKVVDDEKIKEAVIARELQLKKDFDNQIKNLNIQIEKEKSMRQQLLSQYMDLENTEMDRDKRRFSKSFNDEGPSSNVSNSNEQCFDNEMEFTSLMMRFNEMEHELVRLKNENQNLVKHIAKNVEGDQTNNTSTFLTEQFIELQQELERYKTEHSHLKRMILIEDQLTTSSGNYKYQNDLISEYKTLQSKLYKEIEKKDEIIKKLRNNNVSDSSLTLNSNLFPNEANILFSMKMDNKRDFLGMFKFNQSSINIITRKLFYDFIPESSFNKKCDLNTISFISYMCIRHLDHNENEDGLHHFLQSLIHWVRRNYKDMNKKREKKLDIGVYLIACVFKIAVQLKFYSEYDIDPDKKQPTTNSQNPQSSGDSNNCNDNSKHDTSTSENNSEEEDLDYVQSLKNFNVTDYVNHLKELIISIFFKLVNAFEDKINDLIVPALLENKELSGMPKNKNPGLKERNNCDPPPVEQASQTLLREISNLLAMLRLYQLDEMFVFQFFRQIYYFIGAISLNNLMMRKDLCNNNCAIEIIYNISLFDQFLHDHNIMNKEEVKQKLDPIQQATKLMITTKTEKQIPAIVLTTEALTINQVMKLIKMYTPSDEEVLSNDFIKSLEKSLRSRSKNEEKFENKLTLDSQHRFSLEIPYLDAISTEQNFCPLTHFGLKCNFKDVEIPSKLKELELHLEKV